MKDTGTDRMFVVVWIDDMISASKSEKMLTGVKKGFCREYKMKDLMEINSFLGIDFRVVDDKIDMKRRR